MFEIVVPQCEMSGVCGSEDGTVGLIFQDGVWKSN